MDIADLPQTTDSEFFEKIREFDRRVATAQEYFDEMNNHPAESDERLSLLYGGLMKLRWRREYLIYNKTVDQHEAEFGSKPLFLTFKVVYNSWDESNLDAVERALRYSERALDAFPDQPRIMHSFAQAAAVVLEQTGRDDRKLLKRALRVAEKALVLAPNNPNSHSVRGRLYGINGSYRAAIHDLRIAIANEPRDGEYYAIRVMKHEGIRQSILLRSASEEILREVKEAQKDLDSSKAQVIELVALLAGPLVALLTASVSFAAKLPLVEAQRLIAFTGGIISLSLVLTAGVITRTSRGRILLGLALGVGMLGVSVAPFPSWLS